MGLVARSPCLTSSVYILLRKYAAGEKRKVPDQILPPSLEGWVHLDGKEEGQWSQQTPSERDGRRWQQRAASRRAMWLTVVWPGQGRTGKLEGIAEVWEIITLGTVGVILQAGWYQSHCRSRNPAAWIKERGDEAKRPFFNSHAPADREHSFVQLSPPAVSWVHYIHGQVHLQLN